MLATKIKSVFPLFGVALLLALIGAGCGHKNDVQAGAKAVDSAFASASPELKEMVAKGKSQLKAGDYPGAFQEFFKLSHNAQLTPEQRQAVMDALHSIAQKVPPRDPGVAADPVPGSRL